MYFIGNGFSFSTQSWTRGSLWWRQMKSPWIDQKSFRASASSFVSVGWNPSGSPWISTLRSSLPTSCSCLRVCSRNSWSLPDNSAAPSAAGKIQIFASLLRQYFFRLEFFEDKFPLRPYFPILKMSATKISPFQVHAAINAYPRTIPSNTFWPKWWSLDWSRAEIGWYFTNYWTLQCFSASPFMRSFHIGGLGHVADSNSIP